MSDDTCQGCGPGSDPVRALQGVCLTPGYIPIMAAELVAVPCPVCNPGLYLLWSRGGLAGLVAVDRRVDIHELAAARWAQGAHPAVSHAR